MGIEIKDTDTKVDSSQPTVNSITRFEKIDGNISSTVSESVRFLLGSIELPKDSICDISASVEAKRLEDTGITDFVVYISEDPKGLKVLSSSNGPDNPQSSSVNISYKYETGGSSKIFYLTGNIGSKATINPLFFSSIVITKIK